MNTASGQHPAIIDYRTYVLARSGGQRKPPFAQGLGLKNRRCPWPRGLLLDERERFEH